MKIKILYYKQVVHVNGAFQMNENELVNAGAISGSEVRRKLAANEAIPEWLSFPDVIQALRDPQ